MDSNKTTIYEDDDLLSPIDISKILGVSRTTVNYWVRNYGLKADITPGKRYKIRYADLKVFLAFNKMEKRAKLRRKLSNIYIRSVWSWQDTPCQCYRYTYQRTVS